MVTEMLSFYKNKNVFLTGGTGFLGKVLIEKLLRSTEVKHIYVLIRQKRGRDINERVNDIFRDPLFDILHKTKPEVNQATRITAIHGDCMLPNLGLSRSDRMTLIENIDIVIHSAATVRFDEPLSTALTINVRATLTIVQLAKQMVKLKAFVHVSSAFANCTVSHIEERFYVDKLGTSAEKMCQMLEVLGVDGVNSMTKELCRDYPNTYCITKALAEEVVLSQASDLPICIFRPSIVIPTCSEPVAGWIDNLYGPTSILYGVAYGVLRVIYARVSSNATIVPVDFCANAILACAWNTSSVKQVQTEPPIYNLVPDSQNLLKWSEYQGTVEKYGRQMPLSGMIWYPFLITTESKFFYSLLCFFYHTVPGYILDFFLLLFGKKRRMVKTYRKIHKQTAMLNYFVEHEWTFSMENTKQLWQMLSPKDQQLFPFDMCSISWPTYFLNSLRGMRLYLVKEDPSTIPKGIRLWKLFYVMHKVLQTIICGSLSFLLVWGSSWLFGIFLGYKNLYLFEISSIF